MPQTLIKEIDVHNNVILFRLGSVSPVCIEDKYDDCTRLREIVAVS